MRVTTERAEAELEAVNSLITDEYDNDDLELLTVTIEGKSLTNQKQILIF